MDEKIQDLIFQAIDEIISPEDFDVLQDAIGQSEEVRSAYLRAVNLCESLVEVSREQAAAKTELSDAAADRAEEFTGRQELKLAFARRLDWQTSSWLALVAMLLLMVAGTAFWMGRQNFAAVGANLAERMDSGDSGDESRVAGHATFRRGSGVQWLPPSKSFREGDVLPGGRLQINAGIAEIDLFCGATLVVEGPAELDLESDWSVRVIKGRMRATVPPAARGFVVKAADSEIIDLGTEFLLEVAGDSTNVEVIDGEIELRGGKHDGAHLLTGQSRSLQGDPSGQRELGTMSTVAELNQQREMAEQRRFSVWQDHSQQLRQDDRLIAFYPIADTPPSRVVANASLAGSERDGLLVGPVQRTEGRFGPQSAGLDFDRLGSRVRTRIDGEFNAFTFVCWVKIDSLENRFNALFMADSYETGEPHWQIRNDGSLMFSVMVDDTEEVQHYSQIDGKMVKQAGRHRVYYSPPVWDLSKSGQWLHLAAVYDPASRQIVQYVNGEQVSREEIVDQFHVSKLRIGPSEIGNWGQPFRKTPWFAVRNLNGTIDELAIFDAALNANEIHDLFERGKPLGY